MSRTATFLLICGAALLSGCAGKYNPFAEKDKVLPGERRPVFDQSSGFEGPRKLPPPNSDYVGATMRADQSLPPSTPTPPATGLAPAAPTSGKPAPAPAPAKPPPQ